MLQPSGAPRQLGVSCMAPLHRPLASSTAEVEITFHLWPHHRGESSWSFIPTYLNISPSSEFTPPPPVTKHLCFVYVSDLETYLPQERQSVAFKVSRFGLKPDEPPQRLGRFDSLCFGRLFLMNLIWKLHVACSLLVCD